MEMNKSDKEMIARLEAIPIDTARRAIANKEFGDIDSPDHRTVSAWLSAKEADTRDKREKKILLWCIVSAIAACVAAILSFIGVLC